MKELNEFLKEIPENTLYFAYYDILNKLDSYIIFPFYKFEGLPKYINKQELIFYIRREYLKSYYEYRNNNEIFFPKLLIKDTPGYVYPKTFFILSDEKYDIFKNLGFRT